MYRYYIENQSANPIDITDVPLFKDFLISEEQVIEHLQAQIDYIRDGHKGHQIQPIFVGVKTEKFHELIDYLCKNYGGFKKMYFVNRNKIPILLHPNGTELIKIVNSENLSND